MIGPRMGDLTVTEVKEFVRESVAQSIAAVVGDPDQGLRLRDGSRPFVGDDVSKTLARVIDRSGRPGSLLTLAPHRSGHAGSSASGSSADGFATRRWRSERPSSAEEDIAREGGGTASTALSSAATDG